MSHRGISVCCRDVRFGYDTLDVLCGITCEIGPGEFVGIIGPNGSGKTTFLKTLDCEIVPHQGEVLLDGTPVRRMSRRQIARTVAVVPQIHELAFRFTVLELVMMGRAPHLGLLQFESQRDMEIVQWAMHLACIEHCAQRHLSELSGGERQRVFIARALAQESPMIMMDEGTAFLDIGRQVEIMEVMRTLNHERGTTVLMVTQDMNLAAAYCHKLILFNAGRIHSMGTPDQVLAAPEIEAVYGVPVIVDTIPETGTPRVTLSPHSISRPSLS